MRENGLFFVQDCRQLGQHLKGCEQLSVQLMVVHIVFMISDFKVVVGGGWGGRRANPEGISLPPSPNKGYA